MTPEQLASAEASYREAFAVSEAKKAERDALVLAAVRAGWSYAKIADAMGITRGRVGQIATR